MTEVLNAWVNMPCQELKLNFFAVYFWKSNEQPAITSHFKPCPLDTNLLRFRCDLLSSVNIKEAKRGLHFLHFWDDVGSTYNTESIVDKQSEPEWQDKAFCQAWHKIWKFDSQMKGQDTICEIMSLWGIQQ